MSRSLWPASSRQRPPWSPLVLALAVAAVISGAVPASAQLVQLAHSPDQSGLFFSDGSAFDPIHECYFVVSRGSFSSVEGRFIDRGGNTIGAPVTLDARDPGDVSRVAYSPDINDGVGGFGGFVVIWTIRYTLGVFAQIVAFPGRLVGPTITIHAGYVSKADIAYSPAYQVFLVGLGGVTGFFNQPSRIVRLNLHARPIGEAALSSDPNFTCPNSEFPLECNEVGVVWNPVSGEFGALYSQEFEKTFARILGDGTIVSRTPLGIGPRFGALAVNSSTGNYLAVGGSGSQTTDGAEVDPRGNVLASGFITSSLNTEQAGAGVMGLSYSPASGTFLLIGWTGPDDYRSRILELDPHGLPLTSTITLPGFPFVLASHPTAPEWLVGVSRQGKYIIGTMTRFCTTPDPFTALGGGTCVNGGWFPPRTTVPPPPTPVPGGCITPDPFTALGGGTCVNGGWLPPRMTVPPPPTPVPGGCTTRDPFTALGGGTCVNGGWLPPRMTVAPPPPLAPGGCTTPDPFTALGGGTCVNGGWFPPRTTVPPPPTPVPGGCITPDPFTALGGGTCVNDGWLPPGMPLPAPPTSVPGGCTTPDPFVALGGGTCVNGGWIPPRRG